MESLTNIVRHASPEDLPSIVNLERQCPTAAHWSEQQYRTYLEIAGSPAERCVLVVESCEGPGIVGFLVARHLAPEWELENLVVAPEVRRQGIGALLVKTLLLRARETNSNAVFLEVRESNASARRVYERLEFAKTGRRKGYYANPSEDAIVYQKALN